MWRMGIAGLTTFIDENQQLLKDFRLHDTSLIIDGNNVYHFLYYYFQVSHHFGGDYDIFAAKCVFFFSQLTECNIKPFIVFDGAYDNSGKKLKTAMKRATDRIHLASMLSHGGRGKILPILAQETFVAVLKSLDIPHVTCNFEADNQIAALAIKWHCPVLTNDSDFFIYNLPSGVVLLDYMNLKVVERSDCRYMNVQMFYVSNLMKELNTEDSKIVALFATLLGNDVIDGRIFEPFFTRANFPRKKCNLQSVRSNAKFARLVGWLHSIHNFPTAVSIVLSYLRAEKQEDVKEMILNSVVGYTDLKCELDGYFTDSCFTEPVKSLEENVLPQWYIDGINKSEIPVLTLNAVTLRRIILLCQVEMMNESSAHQCSLTIRQFIYAILLSVDNADDSMNKEKQRENKERLIVSEHDRENKHLKCKAVKPLWFLDDERPVPSLDQLPSLAVVDRQNLLLDVIKVPRDDLMKFPLNSQLTIATIIFWVQNAMPKVSALHLEALLVCSVKLGILSSALKQTLPGINDDNLAFSENVISKLEAFACKPHHNHAVKFDGTIIHIFSQFQSCLRSSVYANQLLLLPFPSLDPSQVFNGTFLYNFYRELRGRKDPELYVNELFGRGTSVSLAFSNLRIAIRSLLPAGSLLTVASSLAVKNKKKKKTMEADHKQNNIDVLETKSECELAIYCDINNKFSCLEIEDN